MRGGSGCRVRHHVIGFGPARLGVRARAGKKENEKGTQVSDEATKAFLKVRLSVPL